MVLWQATSRRLRFRGGVSTQQKRNTRSCVGSRGTRSRSLRSSGTMANQSHLLFDPGATADCTYFILRLLQGKRACLKHCTSVFAGWRRPGSRNPRHWLLCPSVGKTHHQGHPACQEYRS
ncbi:unnamed protein product [Ixodes pacificus]